MKTVKSVEQLKRLALSKGSSASFGGSRFNTAADQVSGINISAAEQKALAVPVKVVAPPPEPKTIAFPEIKSVLSSIDSFATSSLQIEQSHLLVMQGIQEALDKLCAAPTQMAPEKSPKQWTFAVERDTRGLMTGIKATRNT